MSMFGLLYHQLKVIVESGGSTRSNFRYVHGIIILKDRRLPKGNFLSSLKQKNPLRNLNINKDMFMGL
jgi:hypothetical protein